MSLTPQQWARITACFDEYQVLSEPDRARALATLEDEDAAVAAEVAALLDADVDDDFLSTLSGRPITMPQDRAARLIGQTLGAYRIEREIGRGGMGVVYEGRHIDPTLDKRVAIKTLALGLDSPELAWRFRRERQILAKLSHPNIAALYDGGTTDDGLPYLVMEYVTGQRIDTWCDAKRLSVRHRLDLFRQVCAAVQFAHAKLIVHRDLKPGNIFVTDDGIVKLLDFGIAKLASADDDVSGDQHELTRAGAAPHTTAYASPEQVRGEPVTTASDVYSLGVILYRLLTGRSPYALDGVSRADARHAISTQPPRAPSDSVTETHPPQCGLPNVVALRDTLRGELDAIVLMALRADADRRYVSADALSADILRYLKGLPVQAKGDSLGYRVRSFVRRQRVLVTAVSIAASALLVGTVASVRAARAANAEAARSQRVTRLLQGVIGSGDATGRGHAEAPTLTATLDSARERVAKEFADDPRARADLYHSFGTSYFTLSRPVLAKAMLDSAYALHSATIGATSIDAIYDLLWLAPIERALGASDLSLEHSRRAVTLLRPLTTLPDSILTRAEIDLASTLTLFYFDGVESPPLLRAAIARERHAAHPRSQLIARGEGVLATALLRSFDLVAADSAIRRSKETFSHDTTATLDGILTRTAHTFYAVTLGGDAAAAAVPGARITLEQMRARFGPDHFVIPEPEGMLGITLLASKRLAEARAVFDSSLAHTAAARTSDPASLAGLFNQRAIMNLMEGDTRAAAISLQLAHKELSRMGTQRPLFLMFLTWSGAGLASATGDTSGARDSLVAAVKIGQTQLGATHPMSQRAVNALALFDSRHPPRNSSR